MIVFYHEHLVKTLLQLNSKKIPSLDDIRYEVKSKAHQGLIALCSIVAVMMIENPEHANPENFIADGEEAQEIRRIVYGNPKYAELLKIMLPLAVEKCGLSFESHF